MIKHTAEFVSKCPVPGILSEGSVWSQHAACVHFLLMALIKQGTQNLS